MKVSGNKSLFISLVLIISCISLWSFGSTFIINSNKNKEFKVKEICYRDTVANLLIDLHVKYPNIVLAQSILESGNFKSKVFLENHNPFGMKLPNNRCTTVLGIKNNHAYYKSVREAVIDYALLQSSSKLFKAKDEDEYYADLKSFYSEDDNYINHLKKIASQLK